MSENGAAKGRWGDPENVVSIIRALGALALLVIGGLVAIGVMQFKISALEQKNRELETVVTSVRAIAQDGMTRVVVLESNVEGVEEDLGEHTTYPCHTQQCQDSARMSVELDQLRREVDNIRGVIQHILNQAWPSQLNKLAFPAPDRER